MSSSKNMTSQPSPSIEPRLEDDLLRLYKDRKFSDITLQVQEQTYPVHKNILCARSPVFCAMFENDTKEKRDGIVHISDIDPATVEKMLTYVYSDRLEFQWESAVLLYSAADKYQIVSLKKSCSSYLVSHLVVPDVLHALFLADIHQDPYFKKSALNFISVNATGIFRSEEWKSFMISSASLAVEVMHFVFQEKKMTCSYPVIPSPYQYTGY